MITNKMMGQTGVPSNIITSTDQQPIIVTPKSFHEGRRDGGHSKKER